MPPSGYLTDEISVMDQRLKADSTDLLKLM
jgi:hypothetical protein